MRGTDYPDWPVSGHVDFRPREVDLRHLLHRLRLAFLLEFAQRGQRVGPFGQVDRGIGAGETSVITSWAGIGWVEVDAVEETVAAEEAFSISWKRRVRNNSKKEEASEKQVAAIVSA